ncbi:MAG TPA: zinc ABC transporter substrate-binding protein, partial [Candidatus Binatus sp.]|nr:zinc ABC transporter substrate-binding protein [Candidatus Binatus sp.]
CTGSTVGSSPLPPGSTGPGDGLPTPAVGGPAIRVVGTENFYADLLSEIGGSRVQAQSFLNDPNVDPHTFESSPLDAQAVADARLVVVNGLGYDDFMLRLLAAAPNPSRVVINVQQLVGVGDGVNVHLWYDPATMPKVAAATLAALERLEPANASYFQARARAYIESLKPIGDAIASLRTRFAGTPIAFTEDVAGYLTTQIGLVVKSPIGFMKSIEEGTDPAPADVAAERDLFTSHAVRVLLYNSQVVAPATQAIHDVAVQSGIPIVGVAETIPPEFQTYVDWQLAELAELGQALAGAG